MEITPTQVGEAKLLPEVERSASKAFLAIPGLAFVADGRLTSAVEHERYIGLGTSWVARVNSQCLGFVCAERFGSDLHVWELSVHADAQRHGIGAGLMAHVIRHAQKEGLESVTLTTFRSVAFNAPFYERFGFVCIEGDARAQDVRLQSALLAEAAHGFPAESRCAMRLRF